MGEQRHQGGASGTQNMQTAQVLRALRRQLLLTRAGMLAERMTRRFWPALTLLLAGGAAVGFGALRILPGEIVTPVAGVFLLLLLALLLGGAWRFRWPSRAAAIERLDRSVNGRPLTALLDRPAIGAHDAASRAVWHAHIARMASLAAQAKSVAPDLRISRLDRFGLRYLAATGFVAALIFGFPAQNGGLAALLPDDGAPLAGTSLFEGWIEPPRYTGLPVIYLNEVPTDAPLAVPDGSKVIIRLYGKAGALNLVETVSGATAGEGGQGAATDGAGRDFSVVQSGEIRIAGAGQAARWQVDVVADTPPMISLSGPVERSLDGQTKLPFRAADDYGVVGGSVRITLDLPAVDRRYGLAAMPEATADISFDIPLPFNGKTTDFSDTIVEDLSRHPWVGLPVIVSLSAVDAKGQTQWSEEEQITLPGRRFFDPLAASIIEQRRDLLWNRDNAARVAQVLRAVSNRPEDIFQNEKAYLVLRAAIRRIELNLAPRLPGAVRDDVSDLLWQVALLIEDGDLSNAEARLKRAQDRLSEALKNGATDQEIARLSRDLRQAMQDYIARLAQNAEKNPDRNQAQNGPSRMITRDQLRQMLDRIEELSRQGRTEEAQQLLKQLNALMKNLRTARQQPGQGAQAMRDLQDTLRQQQGLSDDAFRRMQEQFNMPPQSGPQQPGQGQSRGQSQGQSLGQSPGQPGQRGQGRAESSPGQNGSAGRGELARRQEALRRLLENQRQGLPGAGGQEGDAARQALREADRQMGNARDALRQGDLPQAIENQSQALQALREGLDNLGRALARNQNPGAGRQGDQAGSPDPNASRDPLGRQSGALGRNGTNSDLLTGEDKYRRSRALMDEIRRRTGERRRPKFELDYLNRLLDRF